MGLKRRLDLYAECNVEPRAPMDVFTAECCSRCANPDCSRSHFGDSKFESRISTWYERLFSDVPRMLPDDPRFGKIAGQKFLLIEAAGPAAASSWVDPRDLEARVVVPAPSPPPKAEPKPELESSVAATDALVALVPASPAEAQTSAASSDLVFKNTPVKHGQMLGNRPKPTPGEWQSPTLAEPTDAKVVKTGAKIRIGS